ncbi:MAG: SPOR domain-containing protein [Microcystaceae cyanobacterium]
MSQDAPLRTPIAPTLTASSGGLLPPPPAAPKPTPTTGWGMNSDVSPSDDAGSLLPSTSNAPIPTTQPPVSTSPAWGNRSNRIFNSSLNPAAPRQPVNTVVTSPPVNSQSLRVLALTATPFQQQQVRSLYPEAFNTNYRGQRALQIGRFSSQENAQQALQNLQGAGIQGMIVP